MMAAKSVAQQGAVYFALADGKWDSIDSRGISEFAAHVLTTASHEGKTYTLTGPASITMYQVAAAIVCSHRQDSKVCAGYHRGPAAVDATTDGYGRMDGELAGRLFHCPQRELG